MKVSSKHEAEDLSHEVFLSAWQNLPRYESRGFPFSSWLYKLARNRVIDYYRLAKPNVDLERAESLVAEGISVEAVIDNALEFETVRSALRTLSEDQQDVLILKFLEDCSHSEIAVALGKTEGSVRVIQHRALQQLKKLLSTHDGRETHPYIA